MAENSQIDIDAKNWLLDPAEPGPRYLALRDVFRLDSNDSELLKAKQEAHSRGPIASVLSQMQPAGYWENESPGYSPKYKGTVWSLILLAQLGADIKDDERIQRACTYLLDHSLHPEGMFSSNRTPSGTWDCLQGNLCAALVELGCTDSRMKKAFDWMARSVTGEGIAPQSEKKTPRRYYAYQCGPLFASGANNKMPCAWGAAKVMWAFAKLPKSEYTPAIESAVNQGVKFLLSKDPAKADYPSGYDEKPSRNWWKFGFPVYYITDILQIVEDLVLLGYRQDPLLKNALELIRSKQGTDGKWVLDYNYGCKTWDNFGRKGIPNKWVTIRALRVLA